MNCTLRACNCAAIGSTYLSGILLDYCGAHERIARALPALRSPTATKCANSACEFAPVKTGIFCNTCRKRYHAWGVTQYPKESAVSEAVVPPADGEVAAHLSAIAKIEQDFRTRRDAVAARLEAMGASVYGYTYEIMYTVGSVRVALPRDDKGVAVEDYARQVEQAEEALAGLEAAKAEPDPAEPSAGDVVDAQDSTPDGLVGLAAWEAGAAPLPEDDDIWPPPAAMAVARAWAVATGEEAAHLGRQIRSLCDSDMEVIAIKETARAEVAEQKLAGIAAEQPTLYTAEQVQGVVASALSGFLPWKEVIDTIEKAAPGAEPMEALRSITGVPAAIKALADRDRARRERDEAAEEAAKLRADLEAGSAVAQDEVAQLRAQRDEAEAKLSAIADLLNEDEERSPSYDADDKPIPLVDRVRVALMPDGFGQSAWERRLTRELDRCGAPEGFSPYLRTALIAQALKDERERTKEQAQEIYDAGRVLTILGAPPHLPLREALMRVLSPEDRRAVLEVEAAEARAALVRVRALRVDPAAPGVVAEYEARAAAAQAALNEFPAGEEG